MLFTSIGVVFHVPFTDKICVLLVLVAFEVESAAAAVLQRANEEINMIENSINNKFLLDTKFFVKLLTSVFNR